MKKFLALSALLLLAAPAFAWETIGDGIEYQSWTIEGPNNVFATRMDRLNTNTGIAMTQAKDAYKGNQTVRSQMSDNEGRIFYDGTEWGKRYHVIAGVNGDCYLSGGTSRGIRINDGHFTTSIGHDDAIWGGFYWTADRQALHTSSPVKNSGMNLRFADRTSVGVLDVNVPAVDGNRVLYNAKYGLRTPSDSGVTDMVVRLGKPNIIGMADGKVVSFNPGGNTIIPFDCVVVTAKGTAVSELTAKAKVGDTVTLSTAAWSCLLDHTTQVHLPANTLAAITGWETVLENGNLVTPVLEVLTDRHPRTVVAYNDRYVFFMVCDGRRSGVSIGMTGPEMGRFCRDTLGATDAVCLDGGGSSTMVTNGTVRNRPSDGSERAVANSLIMYNILPKEMSPVFSHCQRVTITASSLNIRRGPGTNNPTITTASSNEAGYITDHEMNGILSGGIYWWEVKFDKGVTGWVSGNYLSGGAKDTTKPSVPKNLAQQSVTGTTITMSWTASTDNYGVKYYKIFRGTAQVGTSETTEFTDKGLANETSYSYRVSAVDFAGNESSKCTAVTMSTHLDRTPPTVPQNVRLETATISSLTITWDPSTDDTAMAGYKVFKGSKQVATLGPNDTRIYTDNSVSPTVTGTYYVSAFDAQGNNSAKSEALKLRCYSSDFLEGFENTSAWTVVRGTLSSAQNNGLLPGANSIYAAPNTAPFMNTIFGGGGYRTGRFGAFFLDSGDSSVQGIVRIRGVMSGGSTGLFLGLGIHSSVSGKYCAEISVTGGDTEYVPLSARKAGWHRLEAEILPGGRLTFMVDYTPVATRTVSEAALCAFRQVYIGNGTLKTGADIYFDDITFDERIPDAPTTLEYYSYSPTSITWSFVHNSDNATKYFLYDTSNNELMTSVRWAEKYITEGGLTPNTRYTRKLGAGAGNMVSAKSSNVNGLTLAAAPCDDTISYTAPGNVSDPAVTLTALTPYGTGTVAYYRVLVNNSPIHAFDDTEQVWNTQSLTLNLPLSSEQQYIHVRAYNDDNFGGDVFNIGPYRYGVPPVSVTEAKNLPDGSPVMIENCTVTAAFSDCAYVAKDGFGIKVTPAGILRVGDEVTIAGTMSTVDGERVIVTGN
ncbi:MAG: phosphodiester glycosidase family protein [Abditibacteriota bacterium]|nr:phosphodiester glycosidase family protein [Abditibacteriota bacterium]